MYYVLVTVYVLVCLVLSMVILLQQGRGGDIASAFGGSSSQAAFGARSGATLLTKATSIAAVLFMLFALTLSVLGQRGGSRSILSGTPAPAATTTPAPAAPAPTTPAPAAPAPAPAK
jgi:preprotein translocase subunit SecG